MLSRPAGPPDAVVRYADHSCGVIDLFLPPTFGHGARSVATEISAGPVTVGGKPGAADVASRGTALHHPSVAAETDQLTGFTGLAARPCRLVVALHGGFWREKWDRTQLRPFAAGLVDRGFVVAIPEYRRGPGAWPDASYDVSRVLDIVADLVEAVAPGVIDPEEPFTVTGHSAGGHLALWGGLRAGPARVQQIVALAPVTDLVAAARTRMGNGAVSDFLGGGPDERPAAYAQADPMRLLPGDVPVTIIQGALDEDVPVEANRAVAHALSTADSVTYVEVPDVEHYALVDPLAAVFAAVVLPHLRG